MLSASKSGSGLATGYNLTRSLRFRASASAYLSKTYSTSQTNNKIQTFSFWVKRGVLSTRQDVFSAYDNTSTAAFTIYFNTDNTLNLNAGGAAVYTLTTTAVYRDPSAWYHIVFSLDTTQATAANRALLYVNGVQVTSFSAASYTTQNAALQFANNAASNVSKIATVFNASQNFADLYLAETNFIDGQALTPSSFGSTNALTGVWQPAPYTGSYGTNGFYLPFTDNSALTTSSNVGLGKDFSGNGNYWTTNNISITAGVTYDSMTDVPTLTSATASNFAVLNPLANGGGTLAGGNLNMTGASAAWGTRLSTIAVSSGKWYAEITPTSGSSTQGVVFGISNYITPPSSFIGTASTSYGYYGADGSLSSNGVNTPSWGATVADNDVVGIALDLDAGTLKLYKNNVQQGSTITGVSGLFYIGVSCYGTATASANFGQRPFTYTPPSGFVALNTYNLPTSTIVKGNTVMDATLYTGTLLSNAITNAASFKPDLVWVKSRSAATSNKLTDSVRGVTKGLVSNTTAAETTDTQGLTAFGSAGFTVGTDTNYNNLAATYVGWQWQAGQGTTSSNTNGTITSTVSVNASAGFSVVTYTGTGANATVGHGLGVAPSMVIAKSRTSGTAAWLVYHSSLGNGQALYLAATSSAASSGLFWNNTTPTSTVFSIGTSSDINVNTQNYVAYCWTPIAGFSAFGSYTGNGSADGVFVYTGFRPRWVLWKRSSAVGDWILQDTARSPYNASDTVLFPNYSDAESVGGGYPFDILSNGFKLRNSAAYANASGSTYIYMAFAENPTKYALAR